MLPVPTLAYLAQFTGRPTTAYTAFADQALTQATLMFGIATQLAAYPDDPDQQQLAVNGILQMADRLYLEQPYAATKATPFSSETIGSYSYSKNYTSLSVKAVQGDLTGVFWWDLAVEELSQRSRSLVMSGSVSVLEHDNIYTTGDEDDRRVLGPADFLFPALPRDDNYELNPRPRLG